jgi:ATP-dependent Clp protease adaptor protein ClpS
MAKTEVSVKIKENIKISEPPFYKVFYINDDVTTMEFVVESLMGFFNHTSESAIELTTDIHNAGSAVVAVLPYEIAEQKGMEVTIEARKQGYPLQVKIESEAEA